MSTNAATLYWAILITGMIALGIFVVVLSGGYLGVSQFGSSYGQSRSFFGLPLLMRQDSSAPAIPDVPWRQRHGPLT